MKPPVNNYWEYQVSRLKNFSNKQLNDLLKGQVEFLSKYPDKDFKDLRNYVAYVKREIAERIGKSRKGI